MSEIVETKQEKMTWGGKRAGAGRRRSLTPRLSKVTTVVLTDELVERLHELGGSKWVRQQIANTSKKPRRVRKTPVATMTSLEDFFEMDADGEGSLTEVIIKNPESTVFCKAMDDHMNSEGIEKGDLLVVDRQIDPPDNALVVVHCADGYSIRKFSGRLQNGVLQANGSNEVNGSNGSSKGSGTNSGYVTSNSKWRLLGVISYVIKQLPLDVKVN